MKGAENDTTAHNLERSQLTQLSTQLLSGILKSRRARGTREETMASTPGQNVHLVLPHNHVVVSSSHLANSSSQLVLSSSLSQSVVELSRRVVESSRRVVESSRRVVFFDLLSRCAITRLFFNSSYYLSTRHVAFQLFVQRSRALFLEKEGT